MNTTTYTIGESRYEDSFDEDIYRFVYKAKTESDAIHNARTIFKSEIKKLTAWQLIKLLLDK